MLDHLRLEDRERRYAAVRLRSDLPLPERDFVPENGGWVLRLPREARVARLEYQLEVIGRDGSKHVVCDPENPERAPGAFGEKSVLLAPGYRPPAWLDWAAGPARFEELGVRLLGRALSIRVWSPGAGQLPLLVAHDGPEYHELAALTRYAGAMIERRAVPPFRLALLPPGDRDEWYSASATYGRALSQRILPVLGKNVEVAGRPVGMGASLGALAMLHAHRAWPGTFAGLFLQSGSFFTPWFDRHESGFPRYGRIARFVRGVVRAGAHPDPLPVAMTCGVEEENIHNNRLMAAALGEQGYLVRLVEVPDLHNYTAWRDALHPHLTRLLARAWPER
ncbi:MAG: hypothetical protein JO262_04680 [Solirubrobacterales bacterium]|nr:hypothetical protein [Solirubrobacterales bacterium]